MKQHWLVIPIDMKYDNRAGPINFLEPANVAQPAEAAPEEAQGDWAEPQARRDARGLLNELQRVGRAQRDAQGRAVGTRYGFKLDRETQKQIDNCFETPELAEKYAVELASQHPGKQYGVFSCVRVFETTTPQVITKKFTDAGELALDTGEQE